MQKLPENPPRENPDAKIIYGRVAIREDFKAYIDIEAKNWGMSTNAYIHKIFEDFLCNKCPSERYDTIFPRTLDTDLYDKGIIDSWINLSKKTKEEKTN